VGGVEIQTVAPIRANFSNAAAYTESSVSIVGITSLIWCSAQSCSTRSRKPGSVQRGTDHALSAMKLAGAVGAASIVNTLPLAPRVVIESRTHAIRPTRLPADDMRMLAFTAIYFVPVFSAEEPTNSGIVAWPAWLMPSRCSTCNIVSHRISRSSAMLQ